MPMAFVPDGLVEGFYDPDAYNPEEGKFIMGLQFHPERMRKPDSDEFDYPGCPAAYKVSQFFDFFLCGKYYLLFRHYEEYPSCSVILVCSI